MQRSRLFSPFALGVVVSSLVGLRFEAVVGFYSNHALILSSSRYWFNYRHVANALSIYQMLKTNGLPDENIILMLADDLPSNSRNPVKNGIYTAGIDGLSLFDDNIEIDYRGEDVTVQNMVNALTGRQAPGLPALTTDDHSNILVYLTGHGGDQFFKFQDVEEIMADQIAAVFRQMHEAKKYHQILFLADTCQAFTLADSLDVPNVTAVGSSLRGENSYAHHSDSSLGLTVIEKYTHAFIEHVNTHGYDLTLKEAMVDPYSFSQQRANVGYRDDLSDRKMDEIHLAEFFMAATEQEGETTFFKLGPVHHEASLSFFPAPVTPVEGVIRKDSSLTCAADDVVDSKDPEVLTSPSILIIAAFVGTLVLTAGATVLW